MLKVTNRKIIETVIARLGALGLMRGKGTSPRTYKYATTKLSRYATWRHTSPLSSPGPGLYTNNRLSLRSPHLIPASRKPTSGSKEYVAVATPHTAPNSPTGNTPYRFQRLTTRINVTAMSATAGIATASASAGSDKIQRLAARIATSPQSATPMLGPRRQRARWIALRPLGSVISTPSDPSHAHLN